ncbi:DUF3825 domain-containing protein [Bradyrhizobium diazoefficiens]|uniref:DUF3825 domain-containing protein n=1 Tax=Bradyrhizobium diazoefficiens TaxID=1355477 RepID=UPI00190AF1F9|nr:DUF3825 domain-containing protein [Bradyrhizobium diazoefficiens]MBK3666272.1 DUF3825 domain-containing protein [Bradyrhizobium diazoefficiens]
MSSTEASGHDDGLVLCRDARTPQETFWPCSAETLAAWYRENRVADADWIFIPSVGWKTSKEARKLIEELGANRTFENSKLQSPKASPSQESTGGSSWLDGVLKGVGSAIEDGHTDVARFTSGQERRPVQNGGDEQTGAGYFQSGLDRQRQAAAAETRSDERSERRTTPTGSDSKSGGSRAALPGRLKGKVKSLNRRQTGGLIETQDGGGPAGFSIWEIVNRCSATLLEGAELECDLIETSKGLAAKNIRIEKLRPVTDQDRLPIGKRLHEWAKVDFNKPHEHDGKRYDNILDALADIALDEPWAIGGENEDKKFPLLRDYLYATFVRLGSASQNKIAIKNMEGKYWAVFNTGLVDKLYNAIYLLFESDTRWIWRLAHIAVPPNGWEGRRLIILFDQDELPLPATYFKDGNEVIMILKQPGRVIPFRDDHIIDDAIKNDRYPADFLERYRPDDLEWEDYTKYPPLPRRKDDIPASPRGKFLAKYVERMRSNGGDARVKFKDAITNAVAKAQRRTFWNYKTAIPSYYPAADKMQLLLPLSLDSRDEKKVSVALIVNRHPSGAYEGTTIYPLEWAYRHARVVCRPDSDWLKAEDISPPEAADDGEDLEQDD